jgi:hypothetical protein
MVMPGSFGLFRNAGMESGAFCPWIAQEMASASANYATLAAAAGCVGTDDEIVACLVGMNATDVLAAQGKVRGRVWPCTW